MLNEKFKNFIHDSLDELMVYQSIYYYNWYKICSKAFFNTKRVCGMFLHKYQQLEQPHQPFSWSAQLSPPKSACSWRIHNIDANTHYRQQLYSLMRMVIPRLSRSLLSPLLVLATHAHPMYVIAYNSSTKVVFLWFDVSNNSDTGMSSNFVILSSISLCFMHF